MVDHLSNMISQINNAYSARLISVVVTGSKLCLAVLDALERGGYIRGYKYLPVLKIQNKKYHLNEERKLIVLLKYIEEKSSIKKLIRISTSGRRIFYSFKELKPIYNGLGTYILSTSKGVLFDHEAHSFKIGGEVLCSLL